MPNLSEEHTNSFARHRLIWLSLGTTTVLASLIGLWFATQNYGKPKPNPQPPMANTADVPPPANDASSDLATTVSGLRVELGPDDLKKARLRTAHVEMNQVSSTVRAPGIVSPDEYREVHVTPLVGGVIKQVSAVLGDHVRRGQALAIIFSSDLADAETGYLAMMAELDADHKKLERIQKLVKLGAASQQEEEGVEAEHAGHEAHVRASLEKLKLLGASASQIAALQRAEQIDANFSLPAPINGIVLTRTANPGLVTSMAQELFTVANLSTVWVMASLNEKDFALVRVGTAATLTAAAYPGRVWKGHVAYIQPQIDPNTRTAQARIEVANPDESLRLNMYTDVAFTSLGGKGLAIPESAVQAIGEKQYVFLALRDNEGSFAVRPVRLGPATNRFYSVLDGLRLGDEVITEGSFILKSEAIRQHPEL